VQCWEYLTESEVEKAMQLAEEIHPDEQRESEDSRRGQEHLAEVEKLKYLGVLAGGVAHRVGSKSGLIRLHVQKLRRLIPQEAADAHAVLDKIERETEYLTELSDVLFMPANAAETPVGPVDVNQFLAQAVRQAIIPSDVELTLHKENVPSVVGNRWLVEVFVELITNAVTAMSKSEKKRLTIRPQPVDESRIAVVFEDTGCGIAPEDISKLFTLFYTRGESEDLSGRGGYGLWYSKSIVTRMGGDLQIESEVGKGTTARVLLPVEPS